MNLTESPPPAGAVSAAWPDDGGRPTLAARALALVLGTGAFAIVLAGVDSPLFDLDRHAVPKELALHITALLVLPFLLARMRRVEAGITSVLVAGFVAWSAICALLATNHWIALRALGLTVSGAVLFAAARVVRRERTSGLLLAMLAAAATTGAAIGAAQAYGFDPAWLADERPPGGTFGNRNFLAHLTVITLPVTGLIALRTRPRTARAALVAIFITAVAVVLTRSRAAWLGVAASACTGLFAFLLLRKDARPGIRRINPIVFALVAGAGAAILVPNRLDWRSSSPYAETLSRITDFRAGSGRGRVIQYRNSLRLVARNPVFGTGPGNWFVEYPLVTTDRDPSFTTADPIPTNPWPSSDWVALLAERGVAGTLLALCIGLSLVIAILVRLLARPAVQPPSALVPARADPVLLEGAVLLCVLAAATVTGAFDAVLLNAAPVFFIACIAGSLAPETNAIVRFDPSRRRRIAAGAIVLVASLSFIALSALQLRSIRLTAHTQRRAIVERALRLDPGNYRLQLLLSRNGPCSARIPHARAAARLLPHHAAPRRALARCGVRSP